MISSACFTESTYALVVASVACDGVPMLVILFPPISTVCEPATVKPPSKSADCVNVAVPVTVTVSPELSPRITLPSAFNCPSTSKFEEKVALLVTANVPAIDVLPSPLVTVNLFVLIVKLPAADIAPLEDKELTVAELDTSKVPFKSTFLPSSISSLPFVVINLI